MPTIFWQEANFEISIDLPNFLTYDCGICNETGTTMGIGDPCKHHNICLGIQLHNIQAIDERKIVKSGKALI